MSDRLVRAHPPTHAHADAAGPGHRDATSPLPTTTDSLADIGAAIVSRPYARRGVSTSDRVVRVLIADDHALVRSGLRMLLQATLDLTVVGEASDGAAAVELAMRHAPDVVVMDLEMPRLDGADAIRLLLEQLPTARVLVVSMHAESERLLETLHAGAHGYLCKDAADRDLLEAIRVVAQGEVYVRPSVARLLAARERQCAGLPARSAAEETFERLSTRERRVVLMTAEGYSGLEVADALGISTKTVDTYKRRVEEKTGMRHRTAYVRFALELGHLHR